MTFDGKKLWQSGEADPWNDLLTNDVAVQIHDVDNDGRIWLVEMIYVHRPATFRRSPLVFYDNAGRIRSNFVQAIARDSGGDCSASWFLQVLAKSSAS